MSEYNIIKRIKRGIASTLVFTMFLSGCGKSEEKKETEPTPTETIASVVVEDENLTDESIANVVVEDENLGSDTTSVNLDAIRKLEEIGYSEFSALQIAKNFSADAINDLLSLPYIEAVENYIYTTDFKYIYLQDYENTRLTLNTTPEKIVSLVNNAYELKNKNFFMDYDITTIVNILWAIDEKLLYNMDYVNYVSILDETFNQVSEDYLLDNITEQDKNTILALPYLALPGTDLNDCFTELSTIYLNILNNPQDSQAKEELYNFILISLTSLTGSKEHIEAAQIRNYIDLYMAFNDIMVPLIPLIDVQMKDYDPATYDNSKSDNIFAIADSLFTIDEYQSLCNGEGR